jgi:hypothetical protein
VVESGDHPPNEVHRGKGPSTVVHEHPRCGIGQHCESGAYRVRPGPSARDDHVAGEAHSIRDGVGHHEDDTIGTAIGQRRHGPIDHPTPSEGLELLERPETASGATGDDDSPDSHAGRR